ncbi:DUF4172 domain-containing protein [Photobacterium damselae]|uniref:DUF4172 domain-containing protein n=1 Tax=Photobacterium damselae TaxID=38293 RepID=UPI001F479C7C|nr:DUF4172 domain-containing protein [Photobacterium damselae]UKA01281.1 DUF4172 domain-containing protein [Photobacterium damselae subsp. damselae]
MWIWQQQDWPTFTWDKQTHYYLSMQLGAFKLNALVKYCMMVKHLKFLLGG